MIRILVQFLIPLALAGFSLKAAAGESREFHRVDALEKLTRLEVNLNFFMTNTLPVNLAEADKAALCFNHLAPLGVLLDESQLAIFNLENGDASLGRATLTNDPQTQKDQRGLAFGLEAFSSYCTDKPSAPVTSGELIASIQETLARVAALKTAVQAAPAK